MKNKIYLLSYINGTWEDKYEVVLKAFERLEDCKKYENKFNKLIQRVLEISTKVSKKVKDRGFADMSDFEEKYYYLYHQWGEFQRTNIEEIEFVKDEKINVIL